jgi:hypothetical protein
VFLRSCDGCLTVDEFFFYCLSLQFIWRFRCLTFSMFVILICWIYFCRHFYLGLRKVYPYYFTFTTFTKGRWVGEKILDVFAREFRAHPVEEYVSHFWFTVIKVVVEFEMWEIRSALFFFLFFYFFLLLLSTEGTRLTRGTEIRFKLVMSLLLRVMYTTVPPSLSARSFVRLSIRLKSGKHALSFFLTVAAAETRGPPVGWHTREQTRDSLVFNLVGVSFHALAVLFLILL